MPPRCSGVLRRGRGARPQPLRPVPPPRDRAHRADRAGARCRASPATPATTARSRGGRRRRGIDACRILWSGRARCERGPRRWPGPTGSLPRPHPADARSTAAAAWLGTLAVELLAPPLEERPAPPIDSVEGPLRTGRGLHGVDPGLADARGCDPACLGDAGRRPAVGVCAPRPCRPRQIVPLSTPPASAASLAGVTTGRLTAWARGLDARRRPRGRGGRRPPDLGTDQVLLGAARDHLVELGLPVDPVALNYDSLLTGRARGW